ncbi:MAG TPA: Asp-tRNA(Asn)/Glu-tRNA(Gln) amidotransferase subunit GatA [Oscillatoriaceae cyanobacterium]
MARGELGARELTEAVYSRIDAVEPRVGAYLTLTRAHALAQAEAIDARRSKGDALGALAGIPIALKDNLLTRGIRTTAASRMLEHYVPPYEATVTTRLNDAGTVCVGKANMDEFAMGSSTENSAFQKTRNPWHLDTVPGGSSGGSAAAVAAGTATLAIGTDTGGSIRQPAAFCGVVGMKPTYGLVSRYGVVAFASSLDQVGPLTRDVRDNALLLSAIAGHDPLDSTSIAEPGRDYTQGLEAGVKGLRIGVVSELMGEGIAPDVRDAVNAALTVLESQGAHVETVSLPHSKLALSTYYVVATAEASSNLARYDGVRYGYRAPEAADLLAMYRNSRAHFGPEVKRRIMLGTYTLAAGYFDAYYKKALQVRTLIKRDYEQAFERFDVLVSPTTPTTAFKLGEKVDDPLTMYLGDVATIPINLAGVPALSLPCGFDAHGLPIGLQLIGKPLAESTLYRTAYAYEQAADHHTRRPALA